MLLSWAGLAMGRDRYDGKYLMTSSEEEGSGVTELICDIFQFLQTDERN